MRPSTYLQTRWSIPCWRDAALTTRGLAGARHPEPVRTAVATRPQCFPNRNNRTTVVSAQPESSAHPELLAQPVRYFYEARLSGTDSGCMTTELQGREWREQAGHEL